MKVIKLTQKTARLNLALNPNVKSKATKIYNHLGLSLSTAVKIFLNQTIQSNGMPFRPNLVPNRDTRRAMSEANRADRYKSYSSEKQMWKDLNS